MTRSSQSDTVTVPRELYDWLVEYAISLQAEWMWKSQETRQRYHEDYADLSRRVVEAVAIRDAKPGETPQCNFNHLANVRSRSLALATVTYRMMCGNDSRVDREAMAQMWRLADSIQAALSLIQTEENKGC